MDHLVVFCSPNGSTRCIATVIARRISELLGSPVRTFDLGRRVEREKAEWHCLNTTEPFCLWVGSPVYVDHPVPLVTRFISILPQNRDCLAVPFVTWGGVNSGIALHEMGEMLVHRGYLLLGAAKVLAVHSSMWQSDRPLGAGHPDGSDADAVRRLVERVHEKLTVGTLEPLPLETLDYQPPAVRNEALKKSIAMAKQAYPPLMVDEERCTCCGDCAANCPARAITLGPYPRIGEDCFMCLKCSRECPENAIPLDMSAAEDRIRAMAAKTNEPQSTRIFH